jgi:hypothetical protein
MIVVKFFELLFGIKRKRDEKMGCQHEQWPLGEQAACLPRHRRALFSRLRATSRTWTHGYPRGHAHEGAAKATMSSSSFKTWCSRRFSSFPLPIRHRSPLLAGAIHHARSTSVKLVILAALPHSSASPKPTHFASCHRSQPSAKFPPRRSAIAADHHLTVASFL